MHKIVACLILVATATGLMAQQNCHCEENFKWVKQTFEKNDAGFQYVIDQKGIFAYQTHNESILAEIKKATTRQQCVEILHKWLLFFRKDHFSISAVYQNPTADQPTWPSITVTEKEIKTQTNSSKPGFEGIWMLHGDTIGLIRQGDQFKGVILSSSLKNWNKNDLKLTINKDSSILFYQENHNPQKLVKADIIGKNTLRLDNIYLQRLYPAYKENNTLQLFTREMCSPLPFIQKISGKTVLLRIPTFKGPTKHYLDSLIGSNAALIKNVPNLIIDIRNNGGGSDASYERIIPFLYTNPIRTQRVLMYSTHLNNQRMLDFYNHADEYGLSEQVRQWAKKSYPILEKHLGTFVNLEPDKSVSIQKLDSVFPNPKNVAIIINENNGSTAEQFLLAARQSKKVKLFGTTTAGVLDISNMYYVYSPDHQFKLGYGLSKSLRIPEMAIDGKGILPDFYMDKSIPETHWLNFVQQTLEE